MLTLAQEGPRVSVHDLSGANASGNFDHANFWDANLSDVNFSNQTSLSDADFGYANLSGADLSGVISMSTIMTCLTGGCPSLLPSGWICEPDPDPECPQSNSYRIVSQ